MTILILGVSGFIGRYLYDDLTQQGHHVIGSSRAKVSRINWQHFDFKQNEAIWRTQLLGIDLVINATGIFQQSRSQLFSHVHDLGPKKLFTLCQTLDIKLIQISAIGAEQEKPVTEFLASKRRADHVILSGKQANIVLYPGIVLGEQGKSTQQLSLLARLFCTPMALEKSTILPMISIEQLSEHIQFLIKNWPSSSYAKVMVAQPETIELLLGNLRRWMGLKHGYFIWLPKQFLSFLFALFPRISIGVFNKQSINMLSAYSSTSYQPVTTETASHSLLKDSASTEFNKKTQLNMLFYFNLMTLSIIWIMSGLSSLISIDTSRDLISSLHMDIKWGELFIFTAAIGDIILGVLLFFPKFRAWVIKLQIAVIITYSLIISLFIPEFWLHPFAPIIKNMAMIVLALYLFIEERE